MDKATRTKMKEFIYLARVLQEIRNELNETGFIRFSASSDEIQLGSGIEEFARLFGCDIETRTYSNNYKCKETTINGVKLWQ